MVMMKRSDELLRCPEKTGETWHTPVRGKETDDIEKYMGEREW
jgi:hypothetical protein